MDIHTLWEKTLKKTRVIRPRVQPLQVHGSTSLPYVFLAESAVNPGDTVVRKGEVLVDEPRIVLPSNLPQFEGFELDEEWKSAQNYVMNFLMIRGIRFPSHKFENKGTHLDIFEGTLPQATAHFRKMLESQENINTGLVIGPEDCWRLSIMVFIGMQILRQADGDMRRLLDEFNRE
jgi:hypothetical protein